MKILPLTILALSLITVARPESENRAALVNELTQLLGVGEMVTDAKQAMNQQANEAIEQLFAQVATSMPGLPEDTWAALRGAADRMIRKVQGSWTAEEAIQVWQAEMSADFTDAELREVIAAAKTPLGRKQMKAGKRANAGLQKFLMERAKVALDAAVREYIDDLQRIVAEAAAKQPPPESAR